MDAVDQMVDDRHKQGNGSQVQIYSF
jgi:hypothetical protein